VGAGSVEKTPRAPRETRRPWVTPPCRYCGYLRRCPHRRATKPVKRNPCRDIVHVPYLSRRYSRKRKLSIAVSRVGGKTGNLADTGISEWSTASGTRQPATSSEMFVAESEVRIR
jgi:hypothetical protein